MKASWSWLATFAEWCGVCVLVAIGLPLIVVALVLLRGVLLIGALLAIVGIGILFVTNPRTRHWFGHDPRHRHIGLRLL